MNDPLKKIESLQDLKLSQSEKSEMFSFIQQHMNESEKNAPAKPIASPFNVFSFFQHHAVYATSFALALILAGGSAAAESALPGDLLYSVKRNMNEGVMQVFAFDTASKAEVQIKLVERRFEEAEQVIAENPEDEATLTALATDIQEHATEALEHIEEVQTDTSLVAAAELSNDLGTTIAAHDSYIDSVTLQPQADAAVMMMAVEADPAPAALTFSKMAAPVDEAPSLQSIIENTRAQVESASGNISFMIASSEEQVVTEMQISDNKDQIANILNDADIPADAKVEVQMLVDAAEQSLKDNNLNTAFIVLEEAERVGESRITQEKLEHTLAIPVPEPGTTTGTSTATSTISE
jgi:hypothetical protein